MPLSLSIRNIAVAAMLAVAFLAAGCAGKNKAGRVYTVTYTVTDVAGNSTSASGTVTVPHDQGKK